MRHESYASILARAKRDDVEAEAAGSMPLEQMKYSMHSYGAQFCEVRVNAVTGEMRVRRFLGSFDCGRILNPKTAASQFRGGIIMGLGLALSEETLFDERSGRVMNPSLAEYHVPVHLDVPEIDVIWTDIPDPQRRSARAASARSASPARRRRSRTRCSTRRASGFATCRSRSTSCCSPPFFFFFFFFFFFLLLAWIVSGF